VTLSFPYLTTVVGSFPHQQAAELSRLLVESLDVPTWPQLPRRSFRESIYAQYGAALPGIVVDDARQKISFGTSVDLSPAFETFYEAYLAGDVESFGLDESFSAGFSALVEALRSSGRGSGWVKGQVIGPISFGLTVTDENLRASMYNEVLADAIVKNAAMNARWQIRRLRTHRPGVIMFVDEPYMASYGSAFISLERELAINMMNEVFDAIHAEGAVSGVHCCANTDWSVLLATDVQILNLDAYGYVENLALYPEELRAFLDRGGAVCWGLIPNNDTIYQETAEDLVSRMRQGLSLICEKAAARGVTLREDEFADRSLIAPSCGLGSATVPVSELVLETVQMVGEILRRG
jgi:hypothetical protein